MRFVIERKRWLRGKGSIASMLLRPSDGKQCCVGQMCSQLGVPDDVLESKKAVSQIIHTGPEQLAPLIRSDVAGELRQAFWLDDAYSTNDIRAIPEEDRESGLRRILAANGHELAFTD